VVTVVACGEEENEGPRNDIDNYLRDTLPGHKITDKKIEDQSLGGGNFIRVQWTSLDAQNRPVRGITYLGYHGTDQCGLTAYEPEAKATSELVIAEAAMKTFARK
jgi:hypothetical protein